MILVLALAAPHASAFTFESIASDGCHERLTAEALELAGWPDEVQVPEPGPDELSLAQNVAFNAPLVFDGWVLAALIGVRDNDLHGAAVLDFPELGIVHQDADDQYEHCLRHSDDDALEGELTAIAGCRDFILSEVEAALGEGAWVDPSETVPVSVALRFQGAIIDLPRYAFHIGRAAHALQDSFTHAYRSEDFVRIRHVFNYVDPAVALSYDPLLDGSPHLSRMDRCTPGDPFDAPRVEAAIEATRALLVVVADPTGGREGRLERVGSVLATYLEYEPGCTPENAWCGGPATYLPPAPAPSGGCGGTSALLLFPGALALVSLGGRRMTRLLAPWALLAIGVASLPVSAAGLGPEVPPEPLERRFGLNVSAGGALDRAGLNASFGLRWRTSPSLMVGIDAEYAPWIDLQLGSIVPGVANAYLTANWRWASFRGAELRSSLNLGTSVLLFDAYRAPSGSWGLFTAISIFNLAVELDEGLWLELRPDITLSVPQVLRLEAVPLIYRQYRISVGLHYDLL